MSPPDPPFDAREIRDHIERHVGGIAEVLPGAAGSGPVEVCRVGPSKKHPFHTLITCGMSARPMGVPDSEPDAPRYLELMMTLPEDWQLDTGSRTSTNWNWPILELRRLADLPLTGDRWLGWGHTIPHGVPPVPFAADTKLCGVILAPSLLVKENFYELHLERGRVAFFSAIPLYREELALRERRGMAALLGKLIDNDIKDVIEPRRKNVARKRFWLF